MSDISISDLGQPTSYGTAPSVSQLAKQDQVTLQRDKNIQDATVLDTLDTFNANAAKNSIVEDLSIATYKGLQNFQDDDTFHMDDEVALRTMADTGVEPQHFALVRGSKSADEMFFNIALAKRDQEFQSKVDNTLTNTQKTTSAFIGTAYDEVAIGVLGGFAGKAASLGFGSARISTFVAAAADASLEAGLVAAKHSLRDDYGVNDAAFDLTLGMAPSGFVAYRSSKIQQKLREDGSHMNGQGTKLADEVANPTPAKKKEADAKKADAKDAVENPKMSKVEAKKFDAETVAAYKTLLNKIHKIEGSLKQASKSKTIKKLQEQLVKLEQSPLIRQVRMTRAMLNDADLVKTMGADIKSLSDGFTKTQKSTLKKQIDKEFTPEEVKAIEQLAAGKKGADDFPNMDKTSKKKLLAVAVALAVVTTSVQASEGESGLDSKDLLLFAAAIAVGASGYKIIKANGGASATFDKIKGRYDKGVDDAMYQTSEDAGAIRRTAVKLSNIVDTEMTNTKNAFKNNIPAMNLIDKMVGKGSTMDMLQRQSFESAMAGINASLKKNFELYRKANPKADIGDFNVVASDYIDDIESIPNPNKHIQAYVDDYHKIMENLYDEAREAGVKGFENFIYDPKTAPRLWKSSDMRNIYKHIGDEDAAKLTENLRQAFHKSIDDARRMDAQKLPEGKKAPKYKRTAEEQATFFADKFVEMWTGSNFARLRQSGDLTADKVKKFLIDEGVMKEGDDMLDDLAESLIPQSQISNRAKRRTIFDPKYIEDMTVSLDGKPFQINKGTFIERDLMQVAELTSKELSVDTALAKHNFKSRSALADEIAVVADGDDTQFKLLSEYARLIEGRPTLTNSPFVESFITTGRAMTSVMKLGMVGFSTVPEFMNVLTRSGLFTGMGSLTRAMTKAYKPTGEVMQLREVTGLASFNDRLYRKGHIGAGDVNDQLNPNKSFSKFVKTAEDYAFTVNRLGWLTDVAQLAGIEANMKFLREFATTGKAAGMSKARLAEFGVDDAWMKEFSGELTASKEMDMSGWTTAKKQRFGSVIRSLNQTVSPESMLHTKGIWMSSTSFGRAVSPLLSYSTTVFNEQGLPLLRHTDRHTIYNNISGVVGTYIGLNMKYAMTGEDVEQEDLMLYAFMGSPIMGGFGTAKGLLNPASVTVKADMFNMLAPEAVEVK